MEGKRRLTVLLGLLAVAIGVVIYVKWPAREAGGPVPRGSRPPRQLSAATQPTAPEVHTEALRAERPEPGAAERNLFRFKPKYVPPPAVVRAPAAPAAPSGPPPPPPIPPIGLKFIGVLEPKAGQRLAILSDGRGAPIYGREGEAVLGQYRIIRIGSDSIELEYIDGRGRQAIRLSGS